MLIYIDIDRWIDSQDRETFLGPFDDKQNRNYDTVLKPPSLPINTKVKGIEPLKDEMVSYIYTKKFTTQCVKIYHCMYTYIC